MTDDARDDDDPGASEFIRTALARFKLGVDSRKAQRDRETAALAFQVPDKQWPDDIKTSRQGQTVGSLVVPPRPMLSIPSLDQPVQLVLNQEKAAHLGVQIHPLSEDADDDTAEVLQGLYRRIEVDSRANLARSWAFERGVKAGTGEYEVDTVYDDEGGSKFDQKIVIKRILHQASVVRDPFAEEPDFSDAMWAFKAHNLQWDTYKQKYPKSKLKLFTEEQLTAVAAECPDWITDSGAGRAIRVAAYYEIRIVQKTAVLLSDGSEAFREDLTDGQVEMVDPPIAPRVCEHRTLWYSIINAIEELEPASEQNGKYIPLIPAIGRELIPFDSERRWTGIIEPNMDAARLLNYSASSAVELAALEPKAPWMIAEGQDEGYTQEFALSNVRNIYGIHYKPTSHLGNLVPAPQRVQADVSKLGPSMMLLQQSREFIHSGTGAFPAALGDADARSKTKGGTLALQQQHDEGNSNFLDNQAEISTPYEAKVVLDLIPHIYDRPGRVARILDNEDNPRTVMLNQAFTVDPKTKRPVKYQGPPQGAPISPASRPIPALTPASGDPTGANGTGPMGAGGMGPGAPAPGGNGNAPPQPEVLHYDLKKGRYGVTVSIGKSYKDRIGEGSDGLSQLFQAEPQLFTILGDLWLKFQTWPGHAEAAERVKKMLPPPLQDEQDAANAQQQLGQMKAQLEQQQQQLAQAADLLKTDKIKADADVEKVKIQSQTQLELQKMKDAAALGVAWINAQTKGVLSAHEAADEAIALGQQQAHEADLAVRQQLHEATLAQQQQQHALEQGQAGAAAEAALADQGQAHALEQGQQAADLAPPPTETGA